MTHFVNHYVNRNIDGLLLATLSIVALFNPFLNPKKEYHSYFTEKESWVQRIFVVTNNQRSKFIYLQK